MFQIGQKVKVKNADPKSIFGKIFTVTQIYHGGLDIDYAIVYVDEFGNSRDSNKFTLNGSELYAAIIDTLEVGQIVKYNFCSEDLYTVVEPAIDNFVMIKRINDEASPFSCDANNLELASPLDIKYELNLDISKNIKLSDIANIIEELSPEDNIIKDKLYKLMRND